MRLQRDMCASKLTDPRNASIHFLAVAGGDAVDLIPVDNTPSSPGNGDAAGDSVMPRSVPFPAGNLCGPQVPFWQFHAYPPLSITNNDTVSAGGRNDAMSG